MLALLETGLPPAIRSIRSPRQRRPQKDSDFASGASGNSQGQDPDTCPDIGIDRGSKLALRHAEERAAMEARRARFAEQAAERHLLKAERAARQGDAITARDSLRRARGTLIDVASGLKAAKSDSRMAPTQTTKFIEQRIESRARRVEQIVRDVERYTAEAESRDDKSGFSGGVGSGPSLVGSDLTRRIPPPGHKPYLGGRLELAAP